MEAGRAGIGAPAPYSTTRFGRFVLVLRSTIIRAEVGVGGFATSAQPMTKGRHGTLCPNP